MKCTWKSIAKRTAVLLTVCGVSVAAIYFGGTRIRQAVSTMAMPEKEPPIIILDAGHGGMDGGCSSVNGVPEKGINLHILLCLRDLLQMEGYTVEVTRDTDRSIHDDGIEGIANQKSSDMDNRLELFNQYDNAICISIHQNQFTDPAYSGAQMFYSDNVKGSGALAQTLQDTFVAQLQPENTREIKQCGKELLRIASVSATRPVKNVAGVVKLEIMFRVFSLERVQRLSNACRNSASEENRLRTLTVSVCLKKSCKAARSSGFRQSFNRLSSKRYRQKPEISVDFGSRPNTHAKSMQPKEKKSEEMPIWLRLPRTSSGAAYSLEQESTCAGSVTCFSGIMLSKSNMDTAYLPLPSERQKRLDGLRSRCSQPCA